MWETYENIFTVNKEGKIQLLVDWLLFCFVFFSEQMCASIFVLPSIHQAFMSLFSKLYLLDKLLCLCALH